MLLLCKWGKVSDKLTIELMRYDAQNSLYPERFDDWAKGGNCPLVTFQRSVNFQEKRELWSKGETKTALELVLMLFKEKQIKWR